MSEAAAAGLSLRVGATDTAAALLHTQLQTPIGTLLLGASEDGLYRLNLPTDESPQGIRDRRGDSAAEACAAGWLDAAQRQLVEYFAGRRRRFDLPLVVDGTHFQRAVWSAVAAVDFAATRSYAQIATAVGRPAAVRAVGNANGANRIAIIIPCHRIIASGGGLGGYGGGLDTKRWLLRHEQEGDADPRHHES